MKKTETQQEEKPAEKATEKPQTQRALPDLSHLKVPNKAHALEF